MEKIIEEKSEYDRKRFVCEKELEAIREAQQFIHRKNKALFKLDLLKKRLNKIGVSPKMEEQWSFKWLLNT